MPTLAATAAETTVAVATEGPPLVVDTWHLSTARAADTEVVVVAALTPLLLRKLMVEIIIVTLRNRVRYGCEVRVAFWIISDGW